MKAITIYRCDICGHTFDSAEKCQICESSHLRPEELIEHPESYEYWQPYPKTVEVRFNDGSTVNYYQEDLSKGKEA